MPQLNRKSDIQQVKIVRNAAGRAATSPSNAQPNHRASTSGAAAPARARNDGREKNLPSSSDQRQHNDVTRKAKPAAVAGQFDLRRRPKTTLSRRPASTASAERPLTTDVKGTRSVAGGAAGAAGAASPGFNSRRWSRLTAAESRKLFSEAEKEGDHSRGKPSGELETANGETPMGSRLPPDLLSLCFLKIESLYHLLNCSQVCKAWREAFLSPMVWKTLYSNWWHEKENGVGIPQPRIRAPPEGYSSWQSAFIERIGEGKKLLVTNEKALAVRGSHLHVRQIADSRGRTVFDCAPGDGMQRLAERLGLTFEIRLNRGRGVKIRGRGKVDIFENSCVARYPGSCISGLDISALKSVEVTVTSDRLLRTCALVEYTRLPAKHWDKVSTATPSAGPLRLLQRRLKPGAFMMVGTLAEGMECLADEVDVKESLLVVALTFHLSDLLWTVMQLGDGPTPYSFRTLVPNDPYLNLRNWSLSVQIHSFARAIWSRHFRNLVFSPQFSVPGETAVFIPESCAEVFPGVLKLPWKSEAFSGCLRGVSLLDATLWDESGCEVAWTSNSAVRVSSVPLAVVEYGIDFDGERVQTIVVDSERGISLDIEMCIPVSFSEDPVSGEKPMIAIRKLSVGMKRNFLQTWCGVANM